MVTSVPPIPDGLGGVIPYLTVGNAPAAIAFYEQAFGAQVCLRVPARDGRLLHAHLQIAGAPVMLSEEFPEAGGVGPLKLGGSAVSMHHYVADVDAAWSRAIEAGCEVMMGLEDTFWGDRYGMLRDPFGHCWSLASRTRLLTDAEILEAAAAVEFASACGREG